MHTYTLTRTAYTPTHTHTNNRLRLVTTITIPVVIFLSRNDQLAYYVLLKCRKSLDFFVRCICLVRSPFSSSLNLNFGNKIPQRDRLWLKIKLKYRLGEKRFLIFEIAK